MPQTNRLIIQQHDPPDLSPVVNKLGDLVNKLDSIVRAIGTKSSNSSDSDIANVSNASTSNASTVDEALQVAATIFTNMVDKNRLNDEKYYKDIANKSIKLGKILVDTYHGPK